METNSSSQWYVFYCASRSEKKVAALLEKFGFEIFLPTVEEEKQWSDRKKIVEFPLFPGYIFVYVPASKITLVSSYKGIVGPLKLANKYGFVREDEIQAIKQLVLVDRTLTAEPATLLPGDEVVVENGPLKGLHGKCLSIAGTQYLFILISALNQLIKVKISANSVRPVK